MGFLSGGALFPGNPQSRPAVDFNSFDLSGRRFIVLMNSFTECWCGIVPAVTGRTPRAGPGRAGQGGPEPFSQNAPYTAAATATPHTTGADLAVRNRARPTAGGNSSGNAGSSSRGFEPK